MHIDSYEFGRIVVDGRAYNQDLILLPDGIQDSWWRQESHLLQIADIAEVLAAKPEVLIVGQGQPGKMQVDAALADYLKENRIELMAMPTAQACTTFNSFGGQKEGGGGLAFDVLNIRFRIKLAIRLIEEVKAKRRSELRSKNGVPKRSLETRRIHNKGGSDPPLQ